MLQTTPDYHLHRRSRRLQDLRGAYGQVGRLLCVDAAEPGQVLSCDGRRLLLVEAEVRGELGDRLVVGVPFDHLGE